MKYTSLKNVQNILNNIIKLCICVFLLCYYFNMLYIHNFSTFLLLFLSTPLIIGFSINLFSVPFIYSFFIGFLIQWIVFLNVNVYPLQNNNKYTIMNYIDENYKPNQEYLLKDFYNKMDELVYPIVLKPIVCSGGARDIYVLRSYEEYVDLILEKYIVIDEYMIQSYMQDYDIEVGVLYERKPWENNGKVIEIVEKKMKSELRPFVEGMMEDRSYLINDKINKLFDTLAKKIPRLLVGRFDVRLKNLEDLENGYIKIMEVNGTMGMRLSYDEILTIDNVFNSYNLYYDGIWYFTRLQFGSYNILTGQGYSPLNLLQCMYMSLVNALSCNSYGNWENLLSLYS